MVTAMAENKKSFLMYCDWLELFDGLPDEMAGKLIKHIFKYTNDKNPKTDNLVLKTAFTLIKQQLKRDLSSWESETKKRVEAGRKGGLVTQSKRKQSQALLKDTKANQADTVKVTVNDTVNVNDNVTVKDKKKNLKRVERFTPPALNELKDYFFQKLQSIELSTDESKKFMDHYTSNGWMVGKNKMKDWRATVNKWVSRRKEFNNDKGDSKERQQRIFDGLANKQQ